MSRNPERGRFVVLEGLDGAGTTTQTELLARRLRDAGEKVLTTREPSDGPLGLLLRQALTRRLSLPGGQGALRAETLALLFAADRMDHLQAQVEPALAAGTFVLCDRYVLSSLAYQGASLEMDWVASLNGKARAPDLTLFVEVSVDNASKRRRARGGDEELFDADEQQRRIAAQYLRAIKKVGKAQRVVRIDGNEGIAAVTEACWQQLQPRLRRRRLSRTG